MVDAQSKLVGRDKELGELKTYLDRAVDSKGSTVPATCSAIIYKSHS